MPSARRQARLAVFALCGAIGVGGLTGCETTQEKAAAQRAKAKRILEARGKQKAMHPDQHRKEKR